MTYYQPTLLNRYINIFSISKIEELYLYMAGRPDDINASTNVNKKKEKKEKVEEEKKREPIQPPKTDSDLMKRRRKDDRRPDKNR
jgi:hypothetical protein